MVTGIDQYRMRVWAVPLFAVAYFGIAGLPALLHFGSGEEKYLFYHFFVFTEVPAREQVSYEAVVTAVKGTQVVPILMQDADVLASDELRNKPEYNRLIERLGAEVTMTSLTAERTRAELEAYVRVMPLTYEIHEIRYNPIERYLTGVTMERRSIATFTVQ